MTSFLSVVVPVSERRRFAPATLIHALRLKQSARVFSHLLQHLPKERETDRLRVSISINHLLSLSLSLTHLSIEHTFTCTGSFKSTLVSKCFSDSFTSSRETAAAAMEVLVAVEVEEHEDLLSRPTSLILISISLSLSQNLFFFNWTGKKKHSKSFVCSRKRRGERGKETEGGGGGWRSSSFYCFVLMSRRRASSSSSCRRTIWKTYFFIFLLRKRQK